MDVEQVLRAAPLLKGRLRNRREELKSNLIILTLSEFNEGEQISVSDIQLKLRAKHNIDLEESAVDNILHDLQPSYIQSMGENEYKVLKAASFDGIEDRVLDLWPGYKNILLGHINEMDPYVERRFKSAFSEFFEEYIIELSNSVEELEGKQKEVLLTDWGKTEEFCNRIADSENIDQRKIFRNSIKQYLEEPDNDLLEIVESCYTAAVNIDLLSKEEVIEFPDLPQRNKKLIIDTNILVALLAKTDPQHEIVEIVCQRTSSLDFEIRFTEETERELDSLIEGCKSEMGGLYSGDREIELANNQFVEDFGRQEERAWEDYIGRLENWKEIVAEDYSVKPLEDNRSPDQDIKQESQELFLEHNSYDVTSHKFNNIQSDAKNLGIVASYRKHSNWNFGPFLLSFHHTLTEIGNNIVKSEEYEDMLGDHPIAIQPRSWLNYVMAFTPAEIATDEDKKKTVRSIIKLSAKFEEDINIDEYMHTLAPKVGVEKSNEEHLKRILVNHPTLSEDFEDAVSDNQGNQAERVAREILTDKEYLEQVEEEREYQETIKRASSRIQDLEDELDSLKESTDEGRSGSDEVELRSRFSSISQDFSNSMEQSFDESIFDKPPAKDADVKEIKNWIEITVAMLQMNDSDLDASESLRSELEDVLAEAIELSSE
ncbi:hypothetical protein [Haloarcula salina]|uniref:PIN domain-containing protein n=1 Tax=Haloarcula salina TaxID=1429914 RepID=A0AA41G432_9EURY|nr:hypothetical protein [Haloarcula salina]MBV0903913.1 hypothetical protein [Haloarcula salina]